MEKPWDGVGVGALKRGVGKCKSRGVDLHKKKEKRFWEESFLRRSLPSV